MLELSCLLECVLGQNVNQCTKDSPDVIQQQTGNIVLNSSHRQLPRTETDREEHLEDKILIITEEGRVVQEVKQKGERVQHKAYHTDSSPVGLVTESYESSTEQELEQIGYGTAEDSSIFSGKRERDDMHVTWGNNSTDTWKQRGYRMYHDYPRNTFILRVISIYNYVTR